MRIACLHTAESNIAVFEGAAHELGLERDTLVHTVREDLLAAAEHVGGADERIVRETREVLLALCHEADAVVLTCSTLGSAADGLDGRTAVPVLRADEALAEEAVRRGGKVVVLCAVQTTVAPTTRLFLEAARKTGAEIEVRVVAHAWNRFRAGDLPGYLVTIAQAADVAYDDGASVVALAQASMAAAAGLVKACHKRPLGSPATVLSAAVRSLKAARAQRETRE